jgi:hypothetical protein
MQLLKNESYKVQEISWNFLKDFYFMFVWARIKDNHVKNTIAQVFYEFKMISLFTVFASLTHIIISFWINEKCSGSQLFKGRDPFVRTTKVETNESTNIALNFDLLFPCWLFIRFGEQMWLWSPELKYRYSFATCYCYSIGECISKWN